MVNLNDVKQPSREYRPVTTTISNEDYNFIKENKLSLAKIVKEAIKDLRKQHGK